MERDRSLMEQVRRGDEAAFTELARRYAARLLAVAGRLLGSRADAEDAVQRALLHCYSGAAGYNATRTAYDQRAGAGAVAAGSANHRPPGAYLDLHRALERVPREARMLLALRYVNGLSYGELARIRGISVNTVKSQLARGKSLLRAELGKRGAGHA